MAVSHAFESFEKRDFGNGECQLGVRHRNRERRGSDHPTVMIRGKHSAERLNHDVRLFLLGDDDAAYFRKLHFQHSLNIRFIDLGSQVIIVEKDFLAGIPHQSGAVHCPLDGR